jgi:hypothetical protein
VKVSDKANETVPVAEVERLQEYIAQLEGRLQKYEALAEAVQRSFIWDHTVYEVIPDDQWLSIDRDDCERLLQALAALDRWRPWSTMLENRLSERV